MFLIREVMHCRPGKAGELVKRFKQLEPIMKELGQNRAQRVLTDMSGEPVLDRRGGAGSREPAAVSRRNADDDG